MSCPQHNAYVTAGNHPANNFYVKLWVQRSISVHGSHDRLCAAKWHTGRNKTSNGYVLEISF
jgi:hypothetical protein